MPGTVLGFGNSNINKAEQKGKCQNGEIVLVARNARKAWERSPTRATQEVDIEK